MKKPRFFAKKTSEWNRGCYLTKLKPLKHSQDRSFIFFSKVSNLKNITTRWLPLFHRGIGARSRPAKFWRPEKLKNWPVKNGWFSKETILDLRCSKFGLFSGEILLKLLVFFFGEGFLHPKNTKKPTQPFKRKNPSKTLLVSTQVLQNRERSTRSTFDPGTCGGESGGNRGGIGVDLRVFLWNLNVSFKKTDPKGN